MSERLVDMRKAEMMRVRKLDKGPYRFGLFYPNGRLAGRFMSTEGAEQAKQKLITDGYIEHDL